MISIPFAPWGSILRTHPSGSPAGVSDLIAQVLAHAGKMGIKKMIIRHPPAYYHHSVPHTWLTRAGCRIETEETNQYINLDDEIRLHPMEHRKLKRLNRTHQVVQSAHIRDEYELIRQWRAEQDIPLNISLDHLLHLESCLPGRYDSWAVRLDGHTVAACICVRVTPETIYYFLPGTAPAHRADSPMVLLVDHLCRYYRTQGYLRLDMGLSSISGQQQTGLYRFKERMGARATPQYLLSLSH